MKRVIKELYPYVIILVVVVLIRSFIITPVRVDGDSMKKNLIHGDILMLYRLSDIERYDVIVVDVDGEEVVKRVYGMPNDTIEIKDNVIYINDEEIDDKYNYGETSDYEKITLAEDEYFVLGDNRLISKDSRSIGPIHEDDIEGRVIFRIYPFNKIGSL